MLLNPLTHFLRKNPMPQSKLRLSFIRVENWDQALELRDVRNECSAGMTHNTGFIDVQQQKLFFNEHIIESRGDGKFEAYLLYDKFYPIGYGLLKWDDDKYWMTAGIIKEYRSRGLSRFLISYITEMGHREGHDVWIDVWKDNLALIGDIRVGYEVQEEKLINGRTLLIMKHNRNRLHRLKEQTILEELGSFPRPPRELVADLQETMKEVTYDPMKEANEVNQISIESYD